MKRRTGLAEDTHHGRTASPIRRANYLSVGQIYLMDNPLLKEPLQLKHIKPRLLGHWGTTPGQNFLYVHLNRVIKEHGLNMLYISGPGHGGPAKVANAYLEGTYTEVYPNIDQDEAGLEHSSPSSRSPAEFPATSPRRHPVRYTKAVSWATPCRTPTGRPLTIPT